MMGRCLAVFVFAIVLFACATPARQPAATGPRLEQGGPDADEFGASGGYPVGDRNTFFRIPFLVAAPRAIRTRSSRAV